MLASVIQTGVILWLFSLFVNQPALSMALGGDRACFQLGLIAFTILYSPLSMILGLVMNAWSRKMNIRQMLLLPGITMVNRSFPA